MTITLYRPDYNPETKKYEDTNPIPLRAKGYHYRCLCNHSSKTFTKSSEFTQHFKSKTHRDYINHYESNTKDLNDAHDRIKQLQILVENQHLIILRLQRTMEVPVKKDYDYRIDLD